MNPSTTALAIISGIVAAGSAAAFLARFRRKMDLEQWTVGGRGFGLLLVWLLMAGEIFTAYTFLGAGGWAYSKGGPALFIIAQIPVINVVAFFILPPIWEAGRSHKLQTQADFFQARYGSTKLAALVAFIGVVSLVPYVQLQLTGLGLIMEVASFGGISRTHAILGAAPILAAFVFVSGVRGVAWVSILKDVLLLFAAVFVGIGVPHVHFGGVGPMFAALQQAKPGYLVMPGATKDLGHSWFISNVLLMAFSFYMWPHYFAAAFTARSGDVLRRNAVFMPLYAIAMPLMFFVGFTAILVLPSLPNSDLSVLAMVRRTFPAWFLGVVGGAAALTAMVPAAIQVLTGATLWAKNIFRPMFRPGMSDAQVGKLARVMVLVLTAGALYFAVYTSLSLVSLLMLGYAGVAQIVPGVFLGIFSRRVTAAAVSAGIVVGISTAVFLVLTGRDPCMGMAAGFIALCVNSAVTGLTTLLTTRRTVRFGEALSAAAAATQPGKAGPLG